MTDSDARTRPALSRGQAYVECYEGPTLIVTIPMEVDSLGFLIDKTIPFHYLDGTFAGALPGSYFTEEWAGTVQTFEDPRYWTGLPPACYVDADKNTLALGPKLFASLAQWVRDYRAKGPLIQTDRAHEHHFQYETCIFISTTQGPDRPVQERCECVEKRLIFGSRPPNPAGVFRIVGAGLDDWDRYTELADTWLMESVCPGCGRPHSCYFVEEPQIEFEGPQIECRCGQVFNGPEHPRSV